MSDRPKMLDRQSTGARRQDTIRAAGYAIILASAAAAFLPAGNFADGPPIVGGLMLFVGLLEVIANTLRLSAKLAAIAAGMASLGAGLLIVGQPSTNFVATVHIFIGWLLVRGALLSVSAAQAVGTMRRAALVAAAVDLILAAIVWAGLTASALVIALFGPTKQVIADFAWVLAISFVAAGMLLVKCARCQQEIGSSN